MSAAIKNVSRYQSCIEECNRCSQACLECLACCLREEDVAERDELILTLMECTEICNDVSRFLAMESRHSKEICQMCLNICNECAHMCSMYKDEHCQQCTDECKKCAQECKAVAF